MFSDERGSLEITGAGGLSDERGSLDARFFCCFGGSAGLLFVITILPSEFMNRLAADFISSRLRGARGSGERDLGVGVA